MRQGITRHQKQHDLHYLEFDPENDALITGGSVALVRLAQDGGKKMDFRRFSYNCGHGVWIRKRFLPLSSVGCPGLVTELSWPRQPWSGSTKRRRRGRFARERTG